MENPNKNLDTEKNRRISLWELFASKQVAIMGLSFQLIKYGLVMIVSQIVIISALYVSVDVLNLNEKISYAVILTLIYIGVYISYLKFVFNKDHSRKTLLRFSNILILSWVGNNLLFAVLTGTFHVHYILASILNTIILGGVRFSLNKYYVFR